jgi:DGQHR domain-containing protein
MIRPKKHDVLLEDRVWTLLYRMGFAYLNDKGGAKLIHDIKDPKPLTNQIDVLGIDNELALAVECKSCEKPSRRNDFQEDVSKFAGLREKIANSANAGYSQNGIKLKAVLVIATNNVILSDTDRKRASDNNVILVDEDDIAYYESLTAHLGTAAKYQFFADLLQGQRIPGLELTVPAIKSRMGTSDYYTFSISPDYLLKIAYVSHRLKGKASETDAYQRMIQKARLKEIRKYISAGGIFPTNIVVSLEGSRPQFDKGEQRHSQSGGVLGYLRLRPTYKSAWVIDGQHRLYAFSDHEYASKSTLSVLAFVNLSPQKQAELFTDINAEQKSVSQSLLRELYAELNWGSTDPRKKVQAIVSKAAQVLGEEKDSPLYKRVKPSDAAKTGIRCISLTSVCSALDARGFHISAEKDGYIVEYGPLWAANNDNDDTLKRTVFVLKEWLRVIISSVQDWWDLGAEPGGGLAMSDGVTVCIKVLRSVFEYLDGTGTKLRVLDNKDLFDAVKPFGDAFATYLGSLDQDQRRLFREKRGVQGQTRAAFECQRAIQEQIPAFDPPGLAAFLEKENARTNDRTEFAITSIKESLRIAIIQTLQNEVGGGESQWWMALPKSVRNRVNVRYEDDKAQKGSKEHYFDLADYSAVARELWDQVESELPISKLLSKTAFLKRLNEMAQIEKQLANKANQEALSIETAEGAEEFFRLLDDHLHNNQPGELMDELDD